MNSLGVVGLIGLLVAAGAEPEISPAHREASGGLRHSIRSEFQAGETSLRVVLPEGGKPGERFPVVYILPVEAREERRYGDGLLEVIQRRLAHRHSAIFVAPTFSHLPWYADHPTDRAIRQESYLLQVVIPFVERTYPARTDRSGRLLLGFSKSGWGAFSLLLRHPDRFGKAAAWDAPLMMTEPGLYGSGPVFGTRENFQGYHVAKLLAERSPLLRGEPRLILLGYGNFRAEHRAAHELMQRLDIPHINHDGPERKHDWHSGWVDEAAAELIGPISQIRPIEPNIAPAASTSPRFVALRWGTRASSIQGDFANSRVWEISPSGALAIP